MVLVRVRLGDNELRASTRTAVEAKSRWLRRNSGVGLINVHLVGGAGGEWRDEHRVGSWSRSQRSLEGVGKRQTYPFRASA